MSFFTTALHVKKASRF